MNRLNEDELFEDAPVWRAKATIGEHGLTATDWTPQERLFTEHDVTVIANLMRLEGAPAVSQCIAEIDKNHPDLLTRIYAPFKTHG